MLSLFSKIDKFIVDAKAMAKGAVTKGTKILRELADWLEAEALPLVSTKPKKPGDVDDADGLSSYSEYVEGLVAELEAPRAPDAKPAKIDPTVVLMIAQLIKAALDAIIERRKKKQAPDAE